MIFRDSGALIDNSIWRFEDNKKKIIITTNDSTELTLIILKLTNKELWWRFDQGVDFQVAHFEKM